MYKQEDLAVAKRLMELDSITDELDGDPMAEAAKLIAKPKLEAIPKVPLFGGTKSTLETDEIVNTSLKNPKSTHYELWTNFEAIDVIKLVLTDTEYRGFIKGNILKYQLRLGKKDNIMNEVEKIEDYQRELWGLPKEVRDAR